MTLAGNESFEYLSALDKGMDSAVIHQGYILAKQEDGYDTTKLYEALVRVTEKWRMLAGRVEWDDKRNVHRIRIPLGELHKPAFKFTTAKYDEFIRSPSFSQSHVSPRPDIKYCWDPSTPTTLSRYASLDHPLLSIHVSTLNDATCIGICLPHGVFDAVGVGLVLKAINAELAGQDWTPPPHPDSNPIDTAFVELREKQDLVEGPIPTHWAKTLGALVPATIVNILKILTLLLFEHFFWHSVNRSVFLDKEVVDRLLSEVKEQVKLQSDGKQWVSTGDILVAWFLKAAFTGPSDTNTNAISVHSYVSFRQLLEPRDSNFSAYAHNCFTHFSLPDMSSSRIGSATLAELALIHREYLERGRTLGFVQQVAHHLEGFHGKACVPNVRWSGPTLFFTNQVTAGYTDIDFGQGTSIEAFWKWCPPITLDNEFSINKFKDGYLIAGVMRKCRWEAVEKEIKRVNQGGGFAT